MEQHDPSRRQYAPNQYAAQQGQQGSAQIQGQYPSVASNDRFRQTDYMQQASTGAVSAAGRAGGDVQGVYGFGQTGQYAGVPTLQPSPMQFAQELQTQDLQRQQQQVQYQQYGASSVYSMPQPQAQQQPTQSVYEQVPQYRQRPSGSTETLPSQFGVSQTAQYYLASQSGAASGVAPELASQQIPSQYQQPSYPQPGPSVPQPYPSTMIDTAQAGAFGGYAQQPQYTQQASSSQSVDQSFADYQARVRTIFTLTHDRTLRDIGPHLQYISQYLLGNAEALGLTRDDDAQHDDRIRLWDEFNRAWLAALQCQFDMTQEALQNGQPPRAPQSTMSSQSLEQLSQQLVKLCDGAERHGLVDYQMGVAEEEVMDMLIRCLSLLEPESGDSGDDRGQQGESSAGAQRSR